MSEETTALVVAQLPAIPAITANFDEVRTGLDKLLDEYRGTVVEKGYYKQAKKDRAWLNNLSKSLNTRRREVKAHVLKPYEMFEVGVKDLDAMIAEVTGPIDEQIKRIEAEMKADKRAELVEHYEGYAGIAAEVVPFERIEDAKWLNASVNIQTAKGEIEAIVNKLADDEAALTELELPYADEAKAELFATLDLSRAIAKSRELEKRAEELRRFEEEKAAILAEREAEQPQAPAPEPVSAPTAAVSAPETPAPATETWTFTVSCTADQRDRIVNFLKVLGVTGTASRVKE